MNTEGLLTGGPLCSLPSGSDLHNKAVRSGPLEGGAAPVFGPFQKQNVFVLATATGVPTTVQLL